MLSRCGPLDWLSGDSCCVYIVLAPPDTVGNRRSRSLRRTREHAVVGPYDLPLAQHAPVRGVQGFWNTSSLDMSDTGRTVPDMDEPLSRYNITVTVGCDGDSLPDPTAFAVGADQAAWSRSASIISAHLADKIISVGPGHCARPNTQPWP